MSCIGDELLDGLRSFHEHYEMDYYIVRKTRQKCLINEVYRLLNEGQFIYCHAIVLTVGFYNCYKGDSNAEKDLKSLLSYVIR